MLEARNNIFSGEGTQWALEDGLVEFVSLGGNLSTDESMEEILIESSDIINVDPQFLNTEAGDFRIKVSSPCIDGGLSEGAPDIDITGVFRVGTPDIGAYEAAYDCDADGGSISLSAGGQRIELCQGQVTFSAKHETDSELPYFYIVTDVNDVILKVVSSTSRVIDLSDAPVGECRLWGYSYNRTTVGNVGEDIKSLLNESCADLSIDYITVIRLSEEECDEPCHTPRNVKANTTGNQSNVRWSRVADAKYYVLKISYDDGRTPLLFEVKRSHVNVITDHPYYSVSISAICSYGEESGFSDALWIGNLTDASSMTATARSRFFDVEEINDDLSVSVFPNPVGDNLHLEIIDGNNQGEIEICDMVGRVQISRTVDLEKGKISMDVSTLRDGMYNVRVTDERSGQVKNQMISKIRR